MDIEKDAQRARRHERSVVLNVVRAIWEKAYFEELIVLEYPEGDEDECNSMFNALNDFRTMVKRRKLRMYDLYLYTSSVTLSRPNKRTLKLIRKSTLYSKRTNAVLNVLKKFPELGLTHETKLDVNPVDEILKNIRENLEGMQK